MIITKTITIIIQVQILLRYNNDDNDNDNYNNNNNPGADSAALRSTSKHHQFKRHVPGSGKGASHLF